MQSLLERIKAGTLWDFHGGIHPPENKDQSSLTPVVDAGLPPQLIIPVRQHAGPAGDLLVRVGDQVKKGQPLTRHDKGRFVPVHASTSGTITAIGHHTVAHPSGLDDLCITLTPDGEDAWGERQGRSDYWNLERGELLERIQQAGIAGLGGAVFPTHSKLDGRGQLTEILIVNGLECEPYITTDDRLMQEYADEIMEGIRVLKHLLKPKLTLIGVEDNKPAAIGELTRHATDEDVLVKTVPTKYPSGGAKQTIELLTGRQVPKGGRAVDMGIMVLNVATVFAIKRAIIDGEPLISRIVTLTGDAFKKPGNAWVLLGTPVRWLLQRFELQPEADQRVIMGGPMMGFTLPHAMVPVVKATNCLLSPTRAELPPPGPEQACIRCSACADACPANLLPQELYWYSRAKEYDKAEGLNLFDCIECGACAWVCPSEIPLVQYYKIAKDDIREARAEAEKAERAKQRFEAKQARFEREKAAREARHAEAAAQRRQAMTAAGGEDPVAAALARIKAKQDAAPVGASELAPDNSAMIAAREARKQEAIARRAAKAAASEPGSVQADTPAADGQDAKKAAIAAALARAKAKKAAQEPGEAVVADSPAAAPQSDPIADADPKKAAIAAAIARAKAKKAASTQGDEAAADIPADAPHSDPAADADPKKAAIAAAIARAKAKKAAQAQGDAATEGEEAAVATPAAAPQPDSAANADPKKAAIAAAIARAKAKKAAQAQGDAAVTEGEEAAVAAPAAAPQPDSAAEVDPKKAAIAAAIARAKAKKAAQEPGEEAVAKPAEVHDEEATAKPEVTTVEAPAADALQPAADADPKKAAIAAAVARAKARKLAAEAAAQASPSPSTDKSH
ncbi:electron transport complex subunit RsxC [Aeromonas hydrophila]|uniref:Ion-translocating oxidoreductase complex subunit C n=1 Tax=Aeromonas hydrophila subsp. hydrophila (strain ATCC 7966 / DSM 30187 / BCRC 13018 / CCUG 14551 / JCM 1027 / KCTC 2358 / NCIMB 9240 / NCTC 8049) TaxID=380703 RepID=A0KLJ4_AERHH|nr:electron transport complex subunit RsxC [Aeromonas hydrophila]ABK36998.1 electron transport complex, RnfABCDGE type, C subunit [Aeromonas hydrophila subsp. hydrophila ATCC 7966]MBS4672990.1 electron transport complex subunit RsxC [Aeromonas hydrophila]OOD31254.1 electron transport complex subunit RsxC [Aeromonas hydrophila]SUU29305.1 RnfABCDGE type electron transport complex subunit C [Aeromonas hydrophila]HEG4446565.1 electron transport complex subunit RsxC [Aeromonas hydrophila]